MLHLAPASTGALIALVVCFLLVCVFEFANGFHDTANAVATVIYTNSLKPQVAVIYSGIANFLGVLLGGIAVAYGLVEILPPDTLSPPNGFPAVPMLVALFGTALAWNITTWWFGIPNSSSHCVIGALVGIAVGDAFIHSRALGHSVDWAQITHVLRGLIGSPPLGFILALGAYMVVRSVVKMPSFYRPPTPGETPNPIVRGLLILTCGAVSFSHGSNDGQKSIGLIMLTVIGLMPMTFAFNPDVQIDRAHIATQAQAARPFVEQYDTYNYRGDALTAIDQLNDTATPLNPSALRGNIYQIVTAMKSVSSNPSAPADVKARAKHIAADLRPNVEYAPVWVRALSALCLGLGTMIGYKRIVKTLGEGIGKTHLTPAQGATSELVGGALILSASQTGLPVSTTHIITSSVAGTMVGAGSGINWKTLRKIGMAWVFTLPVTIVVAATLFYILD